MGKVMRHTLGASLNIRHNLSSSKGPKPLQLKLLTTYIPKTSAFTLAFSTSQRLRTTRASARTFFTFRHYITPSAQVSFPLSAADLPPSPTKSSNLSETAEVPACNVPSRSPLPALAIAPETKLGTASSGLGTLEP